MTPETLMTAQEAADWLTARGIPIKEWAVRYAIRHKQLPGRKVGCRYVISEAELRAHFRLPAISPVGAVTTPDGRVIEFMRRRSA